MRREERAYRKYRMTTNKFLNISFEESNRRHEPDFFKAWLEFYRYAPVVNWVTIIVFEEIRLQENWKITLTSIH